MNLVSKDIDEIVHHSTEFIKNFSGKRVLITGGKGFLGRYFIEIFNKFNKIFEETSSPLCEIIILDNFITSGEDGKKEVSYKNMAFIEHDIIKPFYPERPLDFIIHAAGVASPFYYMKYPEQTLEVATTGLKNSLDMALKNKLCRIMFFSSSEIYGDPSHDNIPTSESYNGNVSSLGARACYDADTEILTELGWIKFPELKSGTKVATRNEKGKIEYSCPDEYINYEYDGNLIKFSTDRSEFLVTPNHTMFLKDKRGNDRFIEACNINYPSSWKVVVSGTEDSDDIEWMEFDKPLNRLRPDSTRIKMDLWLEFLGYWISEGSTHIRMHSKELVKILRPIGKSHTKFIPREYLRLSKRQSNILLDALILGDGSVKKSQGSRRGGNKVYYTMSKQLADDVQELAIRSEYAANIYRSSRGLYHVNIRRPIDTKLGKKTNVPYNGRVYCVNVHNHVIMVRRNGKAAWCGNCYDESKRLGETIMSIYSNKYGVEGTIVRPFNVYGPGMQKTDYRVLPNIFSKIRNGERPQIYGNGNQTRTFCYITDAMVGFLRVLVYGKRGEAYNIGNPSPEVSMNELMAHISKDVIGYEIDYDLTGYPDTYPADEPNRRCPSIEKAKSHVGFEAKVTLKEGLSRFYDWTSENY